MPRNADSSMPDPRTTPERSAPSGAGGPLLLRLLADPIATMVSVALLLVIAGKLHWWKAAPVGRPDLPRLVSMDLIIFGWHWLMFAWIRARWRSRLVTVSTVVALLPLLTLAMVEAFSLWYAQAPLRLSTLALFRDRIADVATIGLAEFGPVVVFGSLASAVVSGRHPFMGTPRN